MALLSTVLHIIPWIWTKCDSRLLILAIKSCKSPVCLTVCTWFIKILSHVRFVFSVLFRVFNLLALTLSQIPLGVLIFLITQTLWLIQNAIRWHSSTHCYRWCPNLVFSIIPFWSSLTCPLSIFLFLSSGFSSLIYFRVPPALPCKTPPISTLTTFDFKKCSLPFLISDLWITLGLRLTFR